MPRKVLKTKTIRAVQGGLVPEPPKWLGALAKKYWREIVDGTAASHFKTGDLPLLAQLCDAYATIERVATRRKLAIQSASIEEEEACEARLSELARRTGQLSMKLRICSASVKRSQGGSEPPGATTARAPWVRSA